MEELLSRIGSDLKEAMRARDTVRKNVLKSLKSALDAQGKEKGAELTEAETVAVLKRQHKMRVEAAGVYEQNGDSERAAVEKEEAKVVSGYMPEQMSAGEVDKHIDEAIAATQASTVSDAGRVMGRLSGVLAGKADMGKVAAAVRDRLAK